jgi:hypothetical protein
MVHRFLRSFLLFVIVLVLILLPLSSLALAQEVPFENPHSPGLISESCHTLPANIDAGRAGRELLLAVADMSATFRGQCAAVGRAPHLQVVIHLVGRLHTSAARAITEIRRRPGNELTAIMNLPVSVDSPELLAHEFEHLVEQLDGLCLRTLVAKGAPGVTQNGSGAYETFRAKRVGRQVAAEVQETVRTRRLRRQAATPVTLASLDASLLP